MPNGKHTQAERREILKDDSVPMKIRMGLLGAELADTKDLVKEMKDSIDDFMADQTKRLIVVEEKQKTNTKEIDVLRTRSDKNDIISTVGSFFAAVLVALATFFGFNK